MKATIKYIIAIMFIFFVLVSMTLSIIFSYLMLSNTSIIKSNEYIYLFIMIMQIIFTLSWFLNSFDTWVYRWLTFKNRLKDK